jgi:HNH endonuclease
MVKSQHRDSHRTCSVCIYCRSSDAEEFPREHVIPQSFGSFDDNLTLGCVCGECNSYFAKHLELQFARESAESVARYRHGLRDMESASRTTRIIARINVPGPLLGAKVLLRPNAAMNGIDIVYLPQVGFKNKNAEDRKCYTAEELNSDALRGLEVADVMTLMVTTPDEEERLRSRLRELGLGPTKQISRDEIPPRSDIKTRVICEFDFNMSRCVAKIAFNYLAYVLEENVPRLLQHDFDPVRNYVRHGSSSEHPIVYFSSKPRLDNEGGSRAFVDGHILAVGWDNSEEIIGCGLSLFNAMTYQVILCRKYGGVWFPLKTGHAFNFETGAVSSVPLNVLPAPIL